jgi:hypothetical protein
MTPARIFLFERNVPERAKGEVKLSGDFLELVGKLAQSLIFAGGESFTVRTRG